MSSECKKAALQLKGSRIRKQMPAEREQQVTTRYGSCLSASLDSLDVQGHSRYSRSTISCYFYTLCQENVEICSNAVYSSAASACTMTYNDTTSHDKTILRSSTIGSNCLVQQCPFVSRTAWRCMTISWVRKPGGQVY